MAKPRFVDRMVNMATALVIFIRSTNMVVARTRSNRRTYWDGEKSDLEAQPWKSEKHPGNDLQVLIFTDVLHRSVFFEVPFQQATGNRVRDCGFHQTSLTNISECRARDGRCKQQVRLVARTFFSV